MATPITFKTMREGMIVRFTYNDKPRVVQVDKVAIGTTTNLAYFNGPQLNDPEKPGQIKSFRFADIQGDILPAKG